MKTCCKYQHCYVKADMVCVWVAGKTVWSHCYTRAISERFRVKHYKVLHKFTFFALLLPRITQAMALGLTSHYATGVIVTTKKSIWHQVIQTTETAVTCLANSQSIIRNPNTNDILTTNSAALCSGTKLVHMKTFQKCWSTTYYRVDALPLTQPKHYSEAAAV